MRITIDPRHPRGSVLLLTLVTLALLALMGFAMVGTAITEVGISGATNQGRQAFTRADATARLAILLARPLLQSDAGGPEQYLNNSGPSNRPPFEIELNSFGSLNDIPKVSGNLTTEEIRTRYLGATQADVTPHIILKSGNEVVGAAYITYYTPPPSAGEEENSENHRGNEAYLIVTANGRLPRGEGADPGNYYDGSQDTRHTIVTTIYRDKIQ